MGGCRVSDQVVDEWAELPMLLKVEEAARVLRIGRSKAYELTVEWERTAGRSGLPFVWFGHQKRIPTNWLIRLAETVPDRPQLS